LKVEGGSKSKGFLAAFITGASSSSSSTSFLGFSAFFWGCYFSAGFFSAFLVSAFFSPAGFTTSPHPKKSVFPILGFPKNFYTFSL